MLSSLNIAATAAACVFSSTISCTISPSFSAARSRFVRISPRSRELLRRASFSAARSRLCPEEPRHRRRVLVLHLRRRHRARRLQHRLSHVRLAALELRPRRRRRRRRVRRLCSWCHPTDILDEGVLAGGAGLARLAAPRRPPSTGWQRSSSLRAPGRTGHGWRCACLACACLRMSGMRMARPCLACPASVSARQERTILWRCLRALKSVVTDSFSFARDIYDWRVAIVVRCVCTVVRDGQLPCRCARRPRDVQRLDRALIARAHQSSRPPCRVTRVPPS